jgi:hypothetical protein
MFLIQTGFYLLLQYGLGSGYYHSLFYKFGPLNAKKRPSKASNNFDMDTDRAFQLDQVPNPASTLMRIWIHLPKMMQIWIQIRNTGLNRQVTGSTTVLDPT